MFPVIFLFAVLNAARGSKLFNQTDSTTVGRLVSTGFMSLVTAYLATLDPLKMAEIFSWTWLTLMFWCVFAWDKYWGACIGSPTNLAKAACKPVDWVMRRLNLATVTPMQIKYWGIVAMGIRQSFAIPCIVGLAFLTGHPLAAFWALPTLLFGVLYFIAGFVSRSRAVTLAEFLVGGALGFLISQTIP